MPDIILRNKEMIKETITLEIILKIMKTRNIVYFDLFAS